MSDRSTPKFTRRDFQWIADVIRDMPTHAPSLRTQQKSCALRFADALRATNPGFKRERFLRACGLEEE